MIPLSALPGKALNRVRGTLQEGLFRVGVPAARALRACRLGAVAARLRTPEIIVLTCRSGADATGLFSEFAAVLGILDHYERWQPHYAGVRVDFGAGLYYEGSFGPNWWEYYFEPIDIGRDSGAPARVVSGYYHDLCANRVEQHIMSRDTAARLVSRYVVPQPRIAAIVDAYVREHWGDAMVIGIHYRGTDKSAEAPRVPYQEVATVVRDAIRAAGRPCRLFLATDEQAFVEYMRDRFPAQLLYRDMFRSADGRAIDVVNPDGNHRKGEDAVVDCLLLSRTHALIRTASNLSLCAALFNPHVPETLLNQER